MAEAANDKNRVKADVESRWETENRTAEDIVSRCVLVIGMKKNILQSMD